MAECTVSFHSFGEFADGSAGAAVKVERDRPMTFFAFIGGAVEALSARKVLRAMADRSARTELMRWAWVFNRSPSVFLSL